MMLSRQSLLAIAAVVDVALHARPGPVAAKALASRLDLPPRHLETLLQALVRASILKGVRGPRGGYELARERRRISAGDVVRAVMLDDEAAGQADAPKLVREVISPVVEIAASAFLMALDAIDVEAMCCRANDLDGAWTKEVDTDFTI